MEVDGAEEEEEEEELHFTAKDLMKIRDAVVLLVQSLLRLLQTFPLKNRPQSAGNCTQVSSEFPVAPPLIAVSSCVFRFLPADLQQAPLLRAGHRRDDLCGIVSCPFHFSLSLSLELTVVPAQGHHQAEECSRDGFPRPAAALLAKTRRTERSKIQ